MIFSAEELLQIRNQRLSSIDVFCSRVLGERRADNDILSKSPELCEHYAEIKSTAKLTARARIKSYTHSFTSFTVFLSFLYFMTFDNNLYYLVLCRISLKRQKIRNNKKIRPIIKTFNSCSTSQSLYTII